MLNRRRLASLALAGFGALLATPTLAAGWRDQFKEIRFGISSSENEKDALARHEGMAAYLSKRLGVPVRVFRSTDYAGLIEAMNSNNLDFAQMGAANYALGRKVMGERMVALATNEDNEGSRGYHSIIVVKGDSPYKTLDDLRGRTIAFADPNSTSGYAVPTYFLRRDGKAPETFFSRTGFAGSHEQGVTAVVNGTFDAAATSWTNEKRGNAQRMVEKGMIPAGSYRIIWTSPQIPQGPYVARAEVPEDLRREFLDALLAVPEADPAAWKRYSDGLLRRPVPISHEAYVDIIAITEANTQDRRRSN